MSNRKQEVIEMVAEELIGHLPLHKGPFVSQAEAIRCANYDNQKRFKLAESIATRIIEAEPKIPDEMKLEAMASEYIESGRKPNKELTEQDLVDEINGFNDWINGAKAIIKLMKGK